ncbi:TetR/AcrR family transcriptional regulator [Streptosporangium sp. KLBMP 9127]|nr:TetR/AcrR family transcriptional regulator [Streptosporangium sp. KLBMP 9127]
MTPLLTGSLTGRGSRTRERIVTAAREVFEEVGYLDARVSQITTRAHVAYGTFYTYFDSKEEVFREVAEQLFAEMLGGDRGRRTGGTPLALVRGANRSYYEAYLRNARMMAIIEQVATFNEDFRELRSRHRAASVRRTAGAIRRWQRSGRIAPDLDPELAAAALGAMIDHSLYLWLAQGGVADAERLMDTLDHLVVHALGLDKRISPGRAGESRVAESAAG